MIREEKRTVYCPCTEKQVSIAEYYQLEGTSTCQIDISPFFWQCSEEKNCLSPICRERSRYSLLKQETREE